MQKAKLRQLTQSRGIIMMIITVIRSVCFTLLLLILLLLPTYYLLLCIITTTIIARVISAMMTVSMFLIMLVVVGPNGTGSDVHLTLVCVFVFETLLLSVFAFGVFRVGIVVWVNLGFSRT